MGVRRAASRPHETTSWVHSLQCAQAHAIQRPDRPFQTRQPIPQTGQNLLTVIAHRSFLRSAPAIASPSTYMPHHALGLRDFWAPAQPPIYISSANGPRVPAAITRTGQEMPQLSALKNICLIVKVHALLKTIVKLLPGYVESEPSKPWRQGRNPTTRSWVPASPGQAVLVCNTFGETPLIDLLCYLTPK